MVGAPVRPSEPPAITTTPEANFDPSRPRWGTSSSTRSEIRPAPSPLGAPRGMPISTTTTSPAWVEPGLTRRPTLAPWKVPVAVARTASASTSPVEALTPDGASQAITGALCSLMARIAPAIGSRGEPSKPVPSMASTTAPEPSRASAENSRGPSPGRRSRFAATSPCASLRSATASTSTSRPSSRSRRATTRPSPPLLPLPTTTRTGPSAARAATSRVSPAPARSIRSSDGTSRSSIA